MICTKRYSKWYSNITYKKGSSQSTFSQTYATTQSSSICGDTIDVPTTQQRRVQVGTRMRRGRKRDNARESHLLILDMMLFLVNYHLYHAKKGHTVLLLLMEETKAYN